MFDEDTASYLCQTEPLLRYVSAPAPVGSLAVHPPDTDSGLIADATDLPRLDVAAEQQRLSEALAGLRTQVELHWAPGGRWGDLQTALLAGLFGTLCTSSVMAGSGMNRVPSRWSDRRARGPGELSGFDSPEHRDAPASVGAAQLLLYRRDKPR